jgi:hypothetical protein
VMDDARVSGVIMMMPVFQVDEAKPGAGLGIGLADVDVFDFKRHILGVSRRCPSRPSVCGTCSDLLLVMPHISLGGVPCWSAAGSWCYSKTGQASAGDGFRDYGEKYTTGAVAFMDGWGRLWSCVSLGGGGAGWKKWGFPQSPSTLPPRFSTGDRISMVLNRVDGTVRFYRDDVDQGVAFRESFAGRRLVPALVMGSSSGGKVTKVTILSTTASVPASVRSIRAPPRLFV